MQKMLQSLGVDRIIDYIQQDFTKGVQRYDIFLDCIGNHSLAACRRVLTPDGIYIMVGGLSGRWIGALGPRDSSVGDGTVCETGVDPVYDEAEQRRPTTVREFIESKKVTPVISRHYGLAKVPDAIRYVEEGHVRGKIVIAL